MGHSTRMNTSDRSDAQLQAMSLLATLRTAAEVCQAVALRRAGHDPSDQESPSDAVRHARLALDDLRQLALRLRLSVVLTPDGEHRLVRSFEDRMMMARAARLLHLLHQRMLSLFPAVAPELLEDARILQAEAARLATADTEAFAAGAQPWLAKLASFDRSASGAL